VRKKDKEKTHHNRHEIIHRRSGVSFIGPKMAYYI